MNYYGEGGTRRVATYLYAKMEIAHPYPLRRGPQWIMIIDRRRR